MSAATGPHPRNLQAVFERYHRERDRSDRDALVEQHLPLARHLARRYGRGQDRDDIEQVASLGLVRAVDRYDPARGIAFSSFAVPTILGEIKRYYRDLGWTVRPPRRLQELAAHVDAAAEELGAQLGGTPTAAQLAERCGVSVEEVLEARQTATAHFPDSLDSAMHDSDDRPLEHAVGHEDPELERVENAVEVDRLLARLSPRDAEVVRLRFQHDLVQREIAAKLGMSQMQVSRICSRAIARLAQEASAT
jgi:RNA polymerase sigma-B factor